MQMDPTARVAPLVAPAARALERRRGLFFPVMSLVLLAITIAGFWRPFYGRDAAAAALPAYLVLHGLLASAWFLLAALQPLLVAGGRIALHRRLGWLGAGIAAALVATGIHVIVAMPAQWRGRGIDLAEARMDLGLLLWGNLFALLGFALFLARGIALRRRADAHRRLMLLASLTIMGPAIGRAAGLPVFGGMPVVPLAIGGLLVLGLALVAFDLFTLRRVHRETAWGVPVALVLPVAPALLLPGTAIDDWVFALLA